MRKRLNVRRRFGLEALEPRNLLAAQVVISEFLSANDDGLRDEDGDDEDWIEIHNAGDETANLDGWTLTDNANDLAKWQFPSVAIAPGDYLVVFASNKDRRDPAGQLHTNFRLSNDGEYLALIKSDGATIATEFTPAFPLQATNVSYGIGTGELVTTLVDSTSAARVLVPTNDALDPVDPDDVAGTWLDPGFDDSSWPSGPAAIGYVGEPQPTLIADSVAEFSNVQGRDNWSYGYWNRGTDADGIYATSEYFPFANLLFRTATQKWDLNTTVANVPPTELSNIGARPAGTSSGSFRHVPIRRYTSEVTGELRIDGTLADLNAAGDGAVGRILVNGVEVYAQTVNNDSVNYSVTVAVASGQFVDFLIDAGPASNDTGDETQFTANIFSLSGPPVEPAVFADSVADWSPSGLQGANGWFYGYYNRTADADNTYQASNFTQFPTNYWTGNTWEWPNGDPPWTSIGQIDTHPNGTNNGPNHWTVRRWVADADGQMTVEWTLRKTNAAGDGVTGRVFHNGVEIDTATIAGSNTVGVNRQIVLANVQIGDTIDIAHDSTGVGGNPNAPQDGSDGSANTARILGVPSFEQEIANDLTASMQHVGSSAYVRIPFSVEDPTVLDALRLKIKYDDGFIAYINGQQVAAANAPASPGFDSVATAAHSISETIVYQTFDISGAIDLLSAGTNVLAIHGLNLSAGDFDFFLQPLLEAGDLQIQPDTPKYFSPPTPGEQNGFGTDEVGPIVLKLPHTPHVPEPNEPIVVTAALAPTFAAVGSVTLRYRVMYGNEVTVAMVDDGTGGDQFAFDGIYSATIPGGIAGPGQMVRWYIVAADTDNRQTRLPAYANQFDSEQYFGTVVNNPALITNLPVFHWFVPDAAAATNGSTVYGSLFYNGEFYDTVRTDIHGQSTTGFAKRSFDVDFPRDHRFVLSDDLPNMKDINWLSNWADRTKLRNTLSHETFAAAGSAAHLAFPIRIHQNGQFFSVADFVEDGDDRFLERIGRNPEGALYKIYNTFTTVAGQEKKSREWEGTEDLQAFLNGVNLTGTALTNFLYDNVNLPPTISYLAGMAITENTDCCHKNHYLYRDVPPAEGGTGLWEAMPWDTDLSFGHTWNRPAGSNYLGQDLVWDDGIYTGNNNNFMSKLFANPQINQMYLRRIRTLMDELLQPVGTTASNGYYEQRIIELQTLLGFSNYANPQFNPPSAAGPPSPLLPHDAYDDRMRWGVWGADQDPSSTVSTQEWTTQIQRLIDEWLPNRRAFMYGLAAIPAAQPANTMLSINSIEVRPASGNQAQEFIEIRNANGYAVDISSWTVSGDVDHTFAKGTVIPSNSSLYLANSFVDFRSRTVSPKGGEGRFVQGGYDGQLSARGGTIEIHDTTGRLALSTPYTFPSTATNEQNYLRITEIMYNPAEDANGVYAADDFEFVELRNTGPAPLNLNGVRFTEGIAFDFTGSAKTSLAPGEYVVVVKNADAFAARYGTNGIAVAGTFTGQLDNTGERVRLVDSFGEMTLDFDYEDDWHPVTDGSGFSLNVIDASVGFQLWDSKTTWRPSQNQHGSPGTGDTYTLPAAGSVVINEVMTNTTGAIGDWIELHNTTAAAIDISGWWLSDDETSLSQAKYQIPADTVLPANGYAVFNQRDHFGSTANPANGFGLSSFGDEVVLTAGSLGGGLLGYQEVVNFAASDQETTFGRHVNSVGDVFYPAMASPTPANSNSLPAVSSVVISEVMYNPAAGGIEFVELYNRSAQIVPLFDPANPGNSWRFSSGIEYTFPAGVQLAPGERLVVVGGDPDSFRTSRGLPTSLLILGPFAGSLNNAGERLELSRPSIPDAGAPADIVVDRVDFEPTAPWPVEADGLGSAMGRLVAGAYANDPLNWQSTVNGGTPGAANLFLDVTGPTAPLNLTAVVSGRTQIDLAWAGANDPETGISRYNVYRDDVLYDTTGDTTYSDLAAVPGVSYSYRVAAVNGGGTESTLTAPTPGLILMSIQAVSVPLENRVRLTFSEPVQLAGATNAANYSIDGGVRVLAAALSADSRSVLLTTSVLTAGQSYQATAANIVATSGRPIAPDSRIAFTRAIVREDWAVRHVNSASGAIGSFDAADALLALPTGSPGISSQSSGFYPTINFRDDDGISTTGNFGGDLAFPANTAGNTDDFAVKATTSISIPANGGGDWTFAAGIKPAAIVAVPLGSTWRYLDSGSDLGTAWRLPGYNDTPGQNGWQQGPAQFGYGDGDEQTAVHSGSDAENRPVTTYFRRTFTVTDLSAIKSMAARVTRDDGIAIYLNGVEIARNNLSPGAVYNTLASATVSGAAESALVTFDNLSLSTLISGTNVLAVEVHQAARNSSDLSFDMELLLSTASSAPAPTVSTIVPVGATWKYKDDGSSQGVPANGVAWFGHPSFNDSTWASGPAQLGYGDGDEATVVSFGPDANNRFITTYFRRQFTVADPSQFSKLVLHLLRDDGAAVYLNGVEIARTNLAVGATSSSLATGTVSNEEETTAFLVFDNIDASLLVAGTNTLAVEMHQVAVNSSDISFDLKLEAHSRAADDGVRLRIDGIDVIVAGTGTPSTGRYGTVNLSPGVHEVELVYFERNGGAEVELFAAPGARPYFSSDFKLVGDVAGGGVAISTTGTPPNQPPVVLDVLVAGSTWTASYLDALADAGLGNGGISLAGRQSTGAAGALHSASLDQIKIVFGDDVLVNASQFALFGVNVPTVSLAPGGFSYNAATRTATWTFSQAFAADAYRLVLDDSVTDAGGLSLDGEWTDGVSTYSGNGSAGGDLRVRFDVLPGDVNRSGQTSIADVYASRLAQFTSVGHPLYDRRLDLDGNGLLNIVDLVLARNFQGQTLPAGQPGGSPAAAAAAIVVSDVGTGAALRLTARRRSLAVDRVLDADQPDELVTDIVAKPRLRPPSRPAMTVLDTAMVQTESDTLRRSRGLRTGVVRFAR